jgi:hypothetical protein
MNQHKHFIANLPSIWVNIAFCIPIISCALNIQKMVKLWRLSGISGNEFMEMMAKISRDRVLNK